MGGDQGIDAKSRGVTTTVRSVDWRMTSLGELPDERERPD
jgi:hypothetical protein